MDNGRFSYLSWTGKQRRTKDDFPVPDSAPIIHYSLFTIHYSLFIIHYSLFIIYAYLPASQFILL